MIGMLAIKIAAIVPLRAFFCISALVCIYMDRHTTTLNFLPLLRSSSPLLFFFLYNAFPSRCRTVMFFFLANLFEVSFSSLLCLAPSLPVSFLLSLGCCCTINKFLSLLLLFVVTDFERILFLFCSCGCVSSL
uniref:Uncharacterized protein n=1 Tax=Trypanosoma congolense (strain IL3000) TaxID=1068625 RepID=G0V266_TRYCI|nr:hypothetical protein, unlikely [Trypanosoma congolense IL3000]